MEKTRDNNRRRVIWLTERERAWWLGRLETAAADGEVDAEFLPYLKEINGMDGICTCFCCIGHERKRNGHDVLSVGYLVLRIKKSAERRFWQNVMPVLAKIKGVISVEMENDLVGWDRRRGVYPFFQIAWRQGFWPRVIEPIMKALRGMNEK